MSWTWANSILKSTMGYKSREHLDQLGQLIKCSWAITSGKMVLLVSGKESPDHSVTRGYLETGYPTGGLEKCAVSSLV